MNRIFPYIYLRRVPGSGAVEFVLSAHKLPYNFRSQDNPAPLKREGVPCIMKALREVNYPFGIRVLINRVAAQ